MPAEARCPVCNTRPRGLVATCKRCRAMHHAECFDYAGGCAIYGCKPAAPRALPEKAVPVASGTLQTAIIFGVAGLISGLLAVPMGLLAGGIFLSMLTPSLLFALAMTVASEHTGHAQRIQLAAWRNGSWWLLSVITYVIVALSASTLAGHGRELVGFCVAAGGVLGAAMLGIGWSLLARAFRPAAIAVAILLAPLASAFISCGPLGVIWMFAC